MSFHSVHPLSLFATQIFSNIFIVGFASQNSLFRPAVFPLNALCAYIITNTSTQYMRMTWACLLSTISCTFVLQYLDQALLSKWGYDRRRDIILAPRDKQTKNSQDSIIEKLHFGFISTFSFRYLNTPYEVKNVRPFPNGKVPSRTRLLFQQILILFVCVLIMDGVSAQPPPPVPHNQLFAENKVPLLTRLSEVTAEELIIRVASTISYGLHVYAILQAVQSISAIAAMGLGLSNAEAWRPYFGSLADAYDIRGFWDKFWHQMLRQILSNPASFVTYNVLMRKKGTLSARYCNLMLTFFISGVLHAMGDYGGGLPLAFSGALRFFCTQALGIVIEDAVKACFAKGTSKQTKRPSLGPRLLGYVWVSAFLVWSTPAWMYPVAARSSGESFLTFSIVKPLMEV